MIIFKKCEIRFKLLPFGNSLYIINVRMNKTLTKITKLTKHIDHQENTINLEILYHLSFATNVSHFKSDFNFRDLKNGCIFDIMKLLSRAYTDDF